MTTNYDEFRGPTNPGPLFVFLVTQFNLALLVGQLVGGNVSPLQNRQIMGKPSSLVLMEFPGGEASLEQLIDLLQSTTLKNAKLVLAWNNSVKLCDGKLRTLSSGMKNQAQTDVRMAKPPQTYASPDPISRRR